LAVEDELLLETEREVQGRAEGERPGDGGSPANGARRELEMVFDVGILKRDVADVVKLEGPLAAGEVLDDEGGKAEEGERLRRGRVTLEDGFARSGGSSCCCCLLRGREEREVEDEGGRDESASRRARRRLRVEEVSNDVCRKLLRSACCQRELETKPAVNVMDQERYSELSAASQQPRAEVLRPQATTGLGCDFSAGD
jgi:hypothetical protein